MSLNTCLKLISANKLGLYTDTSYRKQPAHSIIQKYILAQDAQYQTREANTAQSKNEIPSSTCGVANSFPSPGYRDPPIVKVVI